MAGLTKQRMTIQLNIAQSDNNPSVFLWTILPEHINDLKKSTSGGTVVTVIFPKGEQVTLSVTQDIELIKQAIELCRQSDNF